MDNYNFGMVGNGWSVIDVAQKCYGRTTKIILYGYGEGSALLGAITPSESKVFIIAINKPELLLASQQWKIIRFTVKSMVKLGDLTVEHLVSIWYQRTETIKEKWVEASRNAKVL